MNTEIETIAAKLREINNRTMSQPIADKSTAALMKTLRASRLIAQANAALAECEAFYAARAHDEGFTRPMATYGPAKARA